MSEDSEEVIECSFTSADEPLHLVIEEEIEEVTEEFASEEDDSLERTKVTTTMKMNAAAPNNVERFSSLLSVECALGASEVAIVGRVAFPEYGIDLIDVPTPLGTPVPDLDNDNGEFLMETPATWEDNWLFRKKSFRDRVRRSLRRSRWPTEPVSMLVPNPEACAPRVTVGGRDADELSELSERRSVASFVFTDDTEDDDDDEEEDEEKSFESAFQGDLEHTEYAVMPSQR